MKPNRSAYQNGKLMQRGGKDVTETGRPANFLRFVVSVLWVVASLVVFWIVGFVTNGVLIMSSFVDPSGRGSLNGMPVAGLIMLGFPIVLVLAILCAWRCRFPGMKRWRRPS